eukprot:TRINITY_DN3933_c0_g1_i1.p1 TRINITY_DN3933_c0_g1~~TRINITY_DN3933_c0_g1_i1.p1  ORF type:complete len:320 (+),score=115.34 TRINITY_DN3933_c0_g1_i1:185-1144(+)
MPPKKKSTARKKPGGKKPAAGAKSKQPAPPSPPPPPPPPDLSKAEAQRAKLLEYTWWVGGEVALLAGQVEKQLVLTERCVEREGDVLVASLSSGFELPFWPWKDPEAEAAAPKEAPISDEDASSLPPIAGAQPLAEDGDTSTVEHPPETPPLAVVTWTDGTEWHSAKREPVRGTVTLKFNHYKEEVGVEDGRLLNETVDELFAINYVFKNSTISIGPSKLLSHDMKGYYTGLAPGETYVVSVIEDPAEYQRYLDNHKGLEFKASQHKGLGGCVGGSCGKTAADRLTKELKGLSVDEIAEGSDRFKELLEARDREDCLYS